MQLDDSVPNIITRRNPSLTPQCTLARLEVDCSLPDCMDQNLLLTFGASRKIRYYCINECYAEPLLLLCDLSSLQETSPPRHNIDIECRSLGCSCFLQVGHILPIGTKHCFNHFLFLLLLSHCSFALLCCYSKGMRCLIHYLCLHRLLALCGIAELSIHTCLFVTQHMKPFYIVHAQSLRMCRFETKLFILCFVVV